MSGLNRWVALVNVGAETELRYTTSGQAVLNMRLAANEKYKTKEGETKEIVTWINGVVWGPRAEALSKMIAKGDRLYVEGALRVSTYDDKEGVKRTKVEVELREIEFVGGKRDANDGGSSDAGHAQAPAPAQQPRQQAQPQGGGQRRGSGSGSGTGYGGGGGGQQRQPRQQAPQQQAPADDGYGDGGGPGGSTDEIPF